MLLGYPDSNQERQDQNLQCYHYTIPQTRSAIGIISVLRLQRYYFFANLQNFSELFYKNSQKKMQFNINYKKTAYLCMQ